MREEVILQDYIFLNGGSNKTLETGFVISKKLQATLSRRFQYNKYQTEFIFEQKANIKI